MNELELQQLAIILSMIVVNMLKTYGMYLVKQNEDRNAGKEERPFNNVYLVSAMLGVFVGYVAFANTGYINAGSYLDLFMQSGYYALSVNLLFDFAGKTLQKKE